MFNRIGAGLLLAGCFLLLGYAIGQSDQPSEAFSSEPKGSANSSPANSPNGKTYLTDSAGESYLLQTPAARIKQPLDTDWGLGDGHIGKLIPYQDPCFPGMKTPFDLHLYGGKGPSSWGSPNLHVPWDEWVKHCEEQKPELMAEWNARMNDRFDFHGQGIPGVMMSGGQKPVPIGPIARLPKEIKTFEDLANLSAEEIKQQDVFPYKPLAHPLQTTAHMLFPQAWIEAHPEHLRFDVDFDIPDAYLPEFPPPMFLTTHKELGDVTGGVEVTFGNYYEIFDGLLTPEQMEGLKELLRPSPTTWFNHTEHRVTKEPSAGVACFSCHVNGHTNGAIELAPDSRPNLARLRTDTPTMRGNFNIIQLSSKRSIRSMDHFAEVEEYFDGDPGLMQAIGPRALDAPHHQPHGRFQRDSGFPARAKAHAADDAQSQQGDRIGTPRRKAVPWQSPMREMPRRPGLHR